MEGKRLGCVWADSLYPSVFVSALVFCHSNSLLFVAWCIVYLNMASNGFKKADKLQISKSQG